MSKFLAALVVVLATACAHNSVERAPARKAVAAQPSSFTPILTEDSDPHLPNVGTAPAAPTHRGDIDTTKYAGIYDNSQYTPLVDLINSAKNTIDIEIYEMDDIAFRAALRKAMANHVKIRIIKDPQPLGATCLLFSARAPAGGKKSAKTTKAPKSGKSPSAPNADCLDQQKLVGEVKAAGGSFTPFNKAALCGQAGTAASTRCFEHGKIVIIDRDLKDRGLAMISTGNFNGSNLCDLAQNPSVCNRDFSYVTRDETVIGGIAQIFDTDLAAQRLDLKPSVLTDKVTISPYTKSYLIAFINMATSSIQIENQYMEDPEINAAIIAKATKHVQVEMMVASLCSFGPVKGPAVQTDTDNYTKLTDAGVKLRFFTAAMSVHGKPGYLHAKAIVIDGRIAWVGSENGSTESMDSNREYGIFFNHPDRVHFLSTIMASDFDNPKGETLADSLVCKGDKTKSAR